MGWREDPYLEIAEFKHEVLKLKVNDTILFKKVHKIYGIWVLANSAKNLPLENNAKIVFLMLILMVCHGKLVVLSVRVWYADRKKYLDFLGMEVI